MIGLYYFSPKNGKKINTFEEFRRLSDANIQTLANNLPNKFYEYKDFKHE